MRWRSACFLSLALIALVACDKEDAPRTAADMDAKLIVAAEGDPARIAELVLKGANVNAQDKKDVTPLRHARQRGQREIQATLEAADARSTP